MITVSDTLQLAETLKKQAQDRMFEAKTKYELSECTRIIYETDLMIKELKNL